MMTARAMAAGLRCGWLPARTTGSSNASGVPFREPVSQPGLVTGRRAFLVAADVTLLIDPARKTRAVLIAALGVPVFVVSPGHESSSSRQQPSAQFCASAGTPGPPRPAGARGGPGL